jgi:hypothetical protein
LHQNLWSTGINLLSNKFVKKLVVVSSLQFYVKMEELKTYGIATFDMPSWMKEEYRAALEIKEFRDSIRDEILVGDNCDEMIDNKFCLAGGCARWMFSFTGKEVVKDIATHISRLATVPNWLADGFIGTRSDSSVNHLFSVDKSNQAFLVSEFVARALAEKCEESFFKRAHDHPLSSNPTFDGWILEADFLYQVRLGERSKGVLVFPDLNENNSETFWKVKGRREFYSPADIIIPVDDKLEDVWYIPQKWNQGCYDAVHIRPGFSFSFIQVTRSKSHSLKLKYIVEFLDKFPVINDFRICVVLPNETDYENFDLKTPEGTLGKFKDRLKKDENGDEWSIFGLNRHY